MHIVIVGNGITGISAARNLRKLDSNCRITVVSAETKYFFSRTALMYLYMGHLTYNQTKPYEDGFWTKNRIDLLHDYVTRPDFERKTLHLQSGNTIQYDKLLFATGAKSRLLECPGQNLTGVQGLYSLQDLQLMEQNTKGITRAVIVGGGLIGIEVAEMLLSRRMGVTFMVRENSFWNKELPPEESQLINRHITEHQIDLRLSTELQAILPDNEGRVRAVLTQTGEEIPCQFVAITIGVSPNADFLKESGIALERGILVNQYFETNLPDVYAAGDCAQFIQPLADRKSIEQVWYTGQMQGTTVAFNLLGQKTPYQPRIWFNSAKFLDIEYQTYGKVSPILLPNETSLYWEHPDKRKCLRLVYATDTGRLIGINALGIRLRHDVLEEWLAQGTYITHVLTHFAAALFDPEFSPPYEKALIDQYNLQHPHQLLQSIPKRSLWKTIFG